MGNSGYMKTPWHSFKSGELCSGCKLCVQGKKTVLFITGLCSRKCVFCPICSKKYAHDVVFANEWEIKNPDNPVELFEEIKMTGASGVGITGGDPLLKLDRTCNYISLLKKEFGSNFHIHLYTSLDLISIDVLEKLFLSGLDEIRFHFDLDDESLWHRIDFAREFNWSFGVEVPILPNKRSELFRLIDFLKGKVDFLNLNELEFSDTDTSHYDLSNYERKNNSSYAARGSLELGLILLKKCSVLNLNAHLCTAKLKNVVQVGERLKRRALNVALSFDEITSEYLLFRGAIYLKGFEPGFNYKQGSLKKSPLKDLSALKEKLLFLGLFDFDELFIDEVRSRLLSHASLVEKNSDVLKSLNLVPALVEEYPSSDFFCVDLEFL
jgi:pyruvate formate-lyase activating enzyme-like uncharacterized protein